MKKKILISLFMLGLNQARCEVYQWDASRKAFWAGIKPVQLVIDTEFHKHMTREQ